MQRVHHALIRLVGQETALANAAEATAHLQRDGVNGKRSTRIWGHRHGRPVPQPFDRSRKHDD